MDNEDIKSQIEKARLTESLTAKTVVESSAAELVARQSGTEMRVRESVPLSMTPESQKKAEGQIRAGVEEGIKKQLAGVMGERGRTQAHEASANEESRMGGLREGMVQNTRRVEESEEGEEGEEGEEPSMRESQSQVPKRIGQQGETVQRPRLAQSRMPSSPAQAIAKKGMSKALKYALITGGTTGLTTGGFLLFS